MKTFKELFDLYMSFDKETLAKLLAANSILNSETKQKDEKTRIISNPPKTVTVPIDRFHTCKTWADCNNPHFDCVNCPLHGKGYDTNYYTSTTYDQTTNRPYDLKVTQNSDTEQTTMWGPCL